MLFQFSMADHAMFWKFNDAPEAFRKLSDFPAGTELWVAFVPKMYVDWVDMFWREAYIVHEFVWDKYGAKVYIGGF